MNNYSQLKFTFGVTLKNYQDLDGKFYTEISMNGIDAKFETSQYCDSDFRVISQIMYGLKENGLLK